MEREGPRFFLTVAQTDKQKLVLKSSKQQEGDAMRFFIHLSV